jgi:tight adherence protein C
MSFDMIPKQYWPLAGAAAVGLVVLVVGQFILLLGRIKTKKNARHRLVFGPMTEPLAMVVPQLPDQNERLEQDLRLAGDYRPKARAQFLAGRNAVLLAWLFFVGCCVVAAVQPGVDHTGMILGVGGAIAILIYSVPRLVLRSRAAARANRIQSGLPDALDMVSMCVSGGLPLTDALERVAVEISVSHPDVSTEFDIIRRQAAARSLEQALESFARRIDIPDVKSLSAIVSQTSRLGTNVAGALREYSDSVRRSMRQRAEERGNRASVKMLLPVTLCLAPPVYILLLAPALLQLRDFVLKENRPGGILVPADPNVPVALPPALQNAGRQDDTSIVLPTIFSGGSP